MNLNAIHETIIMLHKAKMKQKEIANKLKVGQSTVSRIIQRYKAGADISDQRKFRNGKQLQVSIRCLNHIRIASARNPTATAQEIRAIVGGKCLLLSKRTIQRYLKRVGCLPYRPSKSHNSRESSVDVGKDGHWTIDLSILQMRFFPMKHTFH